MKILAFDLELSPNIAHVWGLWNQNVSLNQLIETQEMMCWAAQWVEHPTDKGKEFFASTFHDGRDVMVVNLWQLLDEADVLMGWNSKNFDTKHANREFIEYGLYPPMPAEHIDLMLVCRKKFKFPSNKLDYVAGKLLGEHKIAHSGHELWVRCMADVPEAWEEMREYCIQDVRLLPKLYEKLLPWVSPHPSWGKVLDGTTKSMRCQACGSPRLIKKGLQINQSTTSYQRYRCKECGHPNRQTISTGHMVAV